MSDATTQRVVSDNSRLRVLVTGIGGRIGRHILEAFQQAYDLRLLDRSPLDPQHFPDPPEVVIGDLQDIEVLKAAMQGVDVVLHLAATSDEAPFIESLAPNNVVGLYNVYEAAHQAGVRRVVFASTVQTVALNAPYEQTVQITDLPRPITMYGATKIFGEALGRYYHDRRNLEVVCIRIGAFQPYDSAWLRTNKWMRDVWLSPGDAVGLFRAAIEKAEVGPSGDVGYALVFGTSHNEYERLSLAPMRDQLGYTPQDRVTDIPYEGGDDGMR